MWSSQPRRQEIYRSRQLPIIRLSSRLKSSFVTGASIGIGGLSWTNKPSEKVDIWTEMQRINEIPKTLKECALELRMQIRPKGAYLLAKLGSDHSRVLV